MKINPMELEWCNPDQEPRQVICYFIQRCMLVKRKGEREASWTPWKDAPHDLNYRGGVRDAEIARAYLKIAKNNYGDKYYKWRIVQRTATIYTKVVKS